MKTSSTFKNALFLFCTLLISTFAVAQTVYIVNNNTGTTADFTSLQAAIDAASNGDTIYIQQSPTSYGNVTINKGLTLVGRSHSETNTAYRTTLGNINIDAGASDTTLNGFNFSYLYATGSSGTVNNLIVKECYFRGYAIGNTNLNFNNVIIQGNFITNGNDKFLGSNTTNVIIKNNVFLETGGTSQDLIFQSAASVLIENNIFRASNTNPYNDILINNTSGTTLTINDCIFISGYAGHDVINLNGGSFELNNCLTYNPTITMNFSGTASVTFNNLQENIDPMFTNNGGLYNTSLGIDNATADFSLLLGSPAIGTALDGGDIGVFDGYNFSMQGQPVSIPYLQIESHSATVESGNPLTVTIKAKAN